MVQVISVTKKGQATIPKRLREKYGIKNKVISEENECGLFLKPVLSPEDLMGSLKTYVKGKTARQLLEEARKEEFAKENELMKHFRAYNI